VNDPNLEFREEVVMNDGAVYRGQVNKFDGTRVGYGIQIWPDGSKYEGYWDADKQNGRGKYTNVAGDVFYGTVPPLSFAQLFF
jgi:hypothetical protein